MTDTETLIEVTENIQQNQIQYQIKPIDSNDLTNIDKVRAWIQDLETALKHLPQIEMDVKHYYSKGVYGRELAIPKDTLVIGKIHKNQTMNVILKGEVTVLSMEGAVKIAAPYTFVSSPGTKRVIYAHENSVWITFHGTHETELDKIEDEIIAKTYDDVIALPVSKEKIECIG